MVRTRIPRVRVFLLGKRCCERSLVMTAAWRLPGWGWSFRKAQDAFHGAAHGLDASICRSPQTRCRRAYQLDLLEEVNRKRLECRKVIVGGETPSEIPLPGDLAAELPALRALGDAVVVGQRLAFLHFGPKSCVPTSPPRVIRSPVRWASSRCTT